jgi:hypothetical protein
LKLIAVLYQLVTYNGKTFSAIQREERLREGKWI